MEQKKKKKKKKREGYEIRFSKTTNKVHFNSTGKKFQTSNHAAKLNINTLSYLKFPVSDQAVQVHGGLLDLP